MLFRSGAETYVVWDEPSETLLTRREALSVAWFTTGGTLDLARNGRDGDDTATSVTNSWTAQEAGEATIFAVLRDERGGVGFTWITLDAEAP